MALYKAGGGSGSQIDTGSLTVSTTQSIKVTLGYKPRIVHVYAAKDNTHFYDWYYAEDMSSSNFYTGAHNGSTQNYLKTALPATSGGIVSIDDDGFTISKVGSSTITSYGSTANWIAVK